MASGPTHRYRNQSGQELIPGTPEYEAFDMTQTVITTEHNVVNPVSTDSNGDVVTDSSGNPAGNVVAERPMDYSGISSMFVNTDVSTTREDPTTDGGSQPTAGARVVSLAFIDSGATAADATQLFVVFNSDNDAAAATALTDPTLRHVILLGERRSWAVAAGSEITRIDFLTDVVIGASNNSVAGEYII